MPHLAALSDIFETGTATGMTMIPGRNGSPSSEMHGQGQRSCSGAAAFGNGHLPPS